MKNAQLIALLQTFPPGATVQVVWDGAARTDPDCVWLSRDGRVILADYDAVVYSEETRPVDAPTEAQDRYWKTAEYHEDC